MGMESLYRAAKGGGGIFVGIRVKQLMVGLVALVGVLLVVAASWEGSPIPLPAVLLRRSVPGSRVPFHLGTSFNLSPDAAAREDSEKRIAVDVVMVDEVQDTALTGDTTVEDIKPSQNTELVEDKVIDTDSLEESVKEQISQDKEDGKVGQEVESKIGKPTENSKDEEVESKISKPTEDSKEEEVESKIGKPTEDSKEEGVETKINKPTEDTKDLEEDTPSLPKAVEQAGSQCDLTSGQWVKDVKRAPYSGESCYKKEWLSFMWACRIYDRPDFEYEKYRWQPDGCALPNLDADAFLTRMQNKVVGFVGDSLGRQQFQSLMCLLTGGGLERAAEDVGRWFGFNKVPKHGKPSGWAYRFPPTNTTVLFYWTTCLCEIEPIRNDPDKRSKMHLDRPAAFLRDYLPLLDVLVLNTGHHWNRGKIEGNKWVMHRGGQPVHDRRFTVSDAYKFTAVNITRWVHQRQQGRQRVFFRSLSPRHFMNGDWNTGGTCDNLGSLAAAEEVAKRPTRDPVAEEAIAGTNVRLLNVTFLSQFRGEAHVSKYGSNTKFQDCLHWCLPGVPDWWNHVLSAELDLQQQSLLA